jgi:DNA-binding transcriptional MocR family regulator
MPRHLAVTAPMYKERLDTMLGCIDRYLPADTEYTRPDGGLFVWLTLAGDRDMQKLLTAATREYKVAFVPGEPFFVDASGGRNTFRLNFSGESPERLEEGLRRLGQAFQAA